MNSEKIKKEAKQIMDDFMKALDKVKDIPESFGAERKHAVRETSKSEYGKEFKEKILKNAPKKEDDCIGAEKKTW